MKNNIARNYVIVGGEGHTTETLRTKVHAEYPDIHTDSLPEACVFAAYLKRKYGLEVDFLEKKSTNCGNNITYLLELLERYQISYKSIILAQDASMQLRMDSQLAYKEDIPGMWSLNHYITLLMGEIPRLRDDINGYGPKGKNFIAHVDIPIYVELAFKELQKVYSHSIREANPLFAS